MKVLFMASVLTACLGMSTQVLASDQTVSLGYAHSNINMGIDMGMEGIKNLNGVNVKYRYDWGSPLSVISSFTYLNSNTKKSFDMGDIVNINMDVKYFSLSAGPAYRLNSWLSVYGLLGINYNKSHATSTWESITGSNRSTDQDLQSTKTFLMYGAGVQINPIDNIAIDIGYEASSVNISDKKFTTNGFNIGVGYRF
ncbi:Ail/Lom family outer membrane beta-barrel protein [Tatumella ptyseos]|uniref:Attachment-invasion locus protein n=2 Tax=Tatumella ptyseos TaxID=82987 RepID=A0A085JPZ9_9GAMM|nr:Ail/Lom family outer membrane beta-barrel protein [Tatumella ptyseos]KFD22545.1 attachment-invasion locus protein [Tatumella ptyseos ATCC 33301]SQK72174.1 Outer membrane protein X precursor [Tatumella ptyseos]